jgi:UDPglucose 6-dehydrogenase
MTQNFILNEKQSLCALISTRNGGGICLKRFISSIFLLLINIIPIIQAKQIIAIIGTGYVGLVTGAGLAELGNNVICADIDTQKIDQLIQGNIPIYEPGLASLVERNVQTGRLSFTSNVIEAIKQAACVFITVHTPMRHNGSANLLYLEDVIKTMSSLLDSYKVIVIKSTVPIGTSKYIQKLLEDQYHINPAMFDLISNPEFLREGCAVNDFLHPDRIVIGSQSAHADTIMQDIYQPLIDQNIPLVHTSIVTAEAIKYVCNVFLALKLSFINEIANLCDATDVNIKDVTYAMSFDKRIGSYFLNPGPGFGGSCFPKDIQALLYTAQHNHIPLQTVQAAYEANIRQQQKPLEKLLTLINNNIAGKTIAVLGLAFKAGTDDVRCSPAITTIKLLQEYNAEVKAYDPAAINTMRAMIPDITYCDSLEEAVTDADAIIVMTEWQEFKDMDLARIKQLMKQPIIIDARNILDADQLRAHNFAFDFIGLSCLGHS